MGQVQQENTQGAAPVLEPPALTEDDFKQKYGSSEVTTVALNVGGQNITCSLVQDKVFLSSANRTKILGASTQNAKPLFLYAGGSWIAEDSKAGVKENLKIKEIVLWH